MFPYIIDINVKFTICGLLELVKLVIGIIPFIMVRVDIHQI